MGCMQTMRLAAKVLWSLELEGTQPRTTAMNDEKSLYPMEDPEKDVLGNY